MNDRLAVRDYLLWLGGFVCPASVQDRYKSLFSVLSERAFVPSVRHDDNREFEGQELRYRYADLEGLSDDFWVGILPEECLILEMLIAMALRIEEDFMHDPELGNRTGQWFWEMLDNLGLADMDDLNYDEDYVQMRINIFLDRDYDRDGVGGLFRLKHCPKDVDMRKTEIWYQMGYYISEKMEEQNERTNT